jgi:hypothetical protein
MILIFLFVNFALNFFLIRAICSSMKPQHTWYVVLGMVVIDLGKAAAPGTVDPFDMFLIVVAGMGGSIVGRNEAAKKHKGEGSGNE